MHWPPTLKELAHVGRLRYYSVLIGVIALNAAFWAFSRAASPSGLPAQRVIAEFLSTSAVVLMSANAVLATRPFVLDRLFGGLDKLFIAHRTDGIAVSLAVAAHFALMPESPGWVPSKLIGYPNITLVLASIALAIAPRSPWHRFVTLRYQDWKLEHRFMGVFLGAAVVHSLLAHPILLALPLARTWVYSMATIGLLAYAYRELGERFVRERHRYQVAETARPAEGVLEIALAPTASPIAHRAGQFAFVRFADGPSAEQHPFTLSAAPVADGRLRFSIKASGDYTRALQSGLAADSLARIEGPYGGFDFRKGRARQLWLAGGIGITPFLAFLGDEGLNRELTLVWSVRNEAEAPYRAEIEAAVTRHPGVEFRLHVTSAQGRLTAAGLGLERPEELSAYLCGPVPMRDAFVTQLLALGVQRREIYYEEFSLR
jgi:predicted ferric reductase